MNLRGLVLASAAAFVLAGSGHVCAASKNGGGDISGGKLLGPSSGNTLMKADTVDYNTESKFITATGHVEIDHNGRIVTADVVTYDQDKDIVVATGNVVMMAPDGTVIFTPRATLTNEMKDGVLEGFQALIGKTGRLSAVHATRKDASITTLQRAIFTHCKICAQDGKRTPLWDVKANRAVYDQNKHRIMYYDATIEALGIPVAYTPYFSQPDPSVKRESGILSPDLGTSTTLGTFIKLPVYISLNDSQDFTIEPILSTHGGEAVEGEYRQRWDNGGMWLQASIADNPHGGINENQRQTYSSLFGSGRIPLNDAVWKFGYDAQLTSNPTYLERYSLYNKDDQLFNDLFLEGVSGRSRFAITGYFFQSLTGECPTTTPATPCTSSNISPLFIRTGQIPLVLPLIEYSYIPEHTIVGGDFRFDLNTASIARNIGPDDQRLTMEARWQLPLVSDNGQLITFRFDARGDVYHTTNSDPSDPEFPVNFLNVPQGSHYISRGLPYVGVDWRWPFVAQGSGFGATAFVVEPIIQAIMAPYGGNPKGIPNEDSTDIELGENDLFSFDRSPGYDLVETGPRANVGFRTEALFPAGSVELLVGETLRLKPDPIFTPDTGLSTTPSDLVGRFTIKFPPYFSLTHRIDIDQSSGSVRRNEVYFDGTYGRSNIQLSYVRLPDQEAIANDESREEVNGQATVGLFDNYIVFAGARRDLANSQMLDDEFGLGYEDECFGISLSYRRTYTRDRDVPPSTSVLFRFRLITDDRTERSDELFPRHLFSNTIL